MEQPIPLLLAHLVQLFGGSLGFAIVALSVGVRVALLPLTVRLARRGLRNQEIMRRLQPEIDALRKKFEKRPEKLFAEMQAVYRKHDYKPFDLPVLLGSLVQLPIFGMLYGAIRSAVVGSGPFLWMRNLASPDALLTMVVLLISAVAANWLPNPTQQVRYWMIAIQVGITAVFIWKLAAGLGLYWGASGLVSAGQNLWLRRTNKTGVAHGLHGSHG